MEPVNGFSGRGRGSCWWAVIFVEAYGFSPPLFLPFFALSRFHRSIAFSLLARIFRSSSLTESLAQAKAMFGEKDGEAFVILSTENSPVISRRRIVGLNCRFFTLP